MFITIEGLDGSGKSTLAQSLGEALGSEGWTVVHTREPGGTPAGQSIRAALLDGAEMLPWTEVFLFLADRHENIHHLVKPALNEGKIVLCDRHIDSTICYQGYGRGLDISKLRVFNSEATGGLLPDLTLLLQMPAEEALRRQIDRNRLGSQSIEFYRRVADGFRTEAASSSARFHCLDATLSPDQILSDALTVVMDRLSRRTS